MKSKDDDFVTVVLLTRTEIDGVEHEAGETVTVHKSTAATMRLHGFIEVTDYE